MYEFDDCLDRVEEKLNQNFNIEIEKENIKLKEENEKLVSDAYSLKEKLKELMELKKSDLENVKQEIREEVILEYESDLKEKDLKIKQLERQVLDKDILYQMISEYESKLNPPRIIYENHSKNQVCNKTSEYVLTVEQENQYTQKIKELEDQITILHTQLNSLPGNPTLKSLLHSLQLENTKLHNRIINMDNNSVIQTSPETLIKNQMKCKDKVTPENLVDLVQFCDNFDDIDEELNVIKKVEIDSSIPIYSIIIKIIENIYVNILKSMDEESDLKYKDISVYIKNLCESTKQKIILGRKDRASKEGLEISVKQLEEDKSKLQNNLDEQIQCNIKLKEDCQHNKEKLKEEIEKLKSENQNLIQKSSIDYEDLFFKERNISNYLFNELAELNGNVKAFVKVKPDYSPTKVYSSYEVNFNEKEIKVMVFIEITLES